MHCSIFNISSIIIHLIDFVGFSITEFIFHDIKHNFAETRCESGRDNIARELTRIKHEWLYSCVANFVFGMVHWSIFVIYLCRVTLQGIAVTILKHATLTIYTNTLDIECK